MFNDKDPPDGYKAQEQYGSVSGTREWWAAGNQAQPGCLAFLNLSIFTMVQPIDVRAVTRHLLMSLRC